MSTPAKPPAAAAKDKVVLSVKSDKAKVDAKAAPIVTLDVKDTKKAAAPASLDDDPDANKDISLKSKEKKIVKIKKKAALLSTLIKTTLAGIKPYIPNDFVMFLHVCVCVCVCVCLCVCVCVCVCVCGCGLALLSRKPFLVLCACVEWMGIVSLCVCCMMYVHNGLLCCVVFL